VVTQQCDFGECTQKAEVFVVVQCPTAKPWRRWMCRKCASFAKLVYSDSTGCSVEEIQDAGEKKD
jgi:hypothetical protein